jgi:hypothetical protein
MYAHTYVHVSRAGLLPSTRRKERLAFRNHIKIFCTILTLRTCLVLACSPVPPTVGVSGGVRPSAPAAAPLRWGCWAVYGQARRLLPPSSGSIISGTSLKSFQRSQQLVWWKLPSSTYISREVHPVNILTLVLPPKLKTLKNVILSQHAALAPHIQELGNICLHFTNLIEKKK